MEEVLGLFSQVPYLDAVVEEVLRCGRTIGAHFRTTMMDTTVLGCRIPKGTMIALPIGGHGFVDEPFAIEEGLRNQRKATIAEPKDKDEEAREKMVAKWDYSDLPNFRPGRWLVADGNGGEVFDQVAAPAMPFSLGPRSCLGRKLAHMQLRFMLVMLVWNFDFLPLPDELQSWDATESLTRRPQKNFVRLAEATWQ